MFPFRKNSVVLDKITLWWHTSGITSKSQARRKRKFELFPHCSATCALRSIQFVGLLKSKRNSLKTFGPQLLKKEQIIKINIWEWDVFPQYWRIKAFRIFFSQMQGNNSNKHCPLISLCSCVNGVNGLLYIFMVSNKHTIISISFCLISIS